LDPRFSYRLYGLNEVIEEPDLGPGLPQKRLLEHGENQAIDTYLPCRLSCKAEVLRVCRFKTRQAF
jgi:hypothetical protein